MPNIRFPNMFDGSSGKVALTYDDELNRQSLKAVLLSNIGELMGDPSYGSDLKSCLFEIQSPMFKTLLQQNIAEAANKWIRGIRINSIEISVSDEIRENDKIVIYYYSKSSGENGIISLAVTNDGKLTTI